MNIDKHNFDIENQINPKKLMALVEGQSFKDSIQKVPNEMWKMEEEDLLKFFTSSYTDHNLRFSFWLHFSKAQKSGRQIRAVDVYEDLCTYAHWHQNILNFPPRLAWLLSPYKTYEYRIKALAERAAIRLHDILALDINDPTTGRPNAELASIVLQAIAIAHAR